MNATTEVTCIRCGEPRWTSLATPYTCQRCREALAGGRATIDPLPSPAQRAARAAAGERLSAHGMENLLAWRALQGRVAITLQGPSDEPSDRLEIPATSTTVFRRGRAFKSGRPSVPLIEQRQKARDRDRAYRARQSGGAA